MAGSYLCEGPHASHIKRVPFEPEPRPYCSAILSPSRATIMAQSAEAHFTVVSVAGPLLVGYLLSWGLYGVICVQVYLYYLSFPRDRLHTKSLVYFVFLLETVQSILVAHDAFEAFAIGFGDVDALTTTHYAWLTMPIMGGIVACIVQIFYAYRIHVLSKSKIIPTIVIFLAIFQCIGAVMGGVVARGKNMLKLTSKVELVGDGMWGAGSAACDIIIAMSMSYYLLFSRRETGVKSTQAILTKILRLVIGTGTLTATITIINLGLFNSAHRIGPIFLTPGVMLSKLYSNSMMVLFNSRIEIPDGRSNAETTGISLPSRLFRTHPPDETVQEGSTQDSRTDPDAATLRPWYDRPKAQHETVPLHEDVETGDSKKKSVGIV
ncbi:hypothetical protein BDQ12DRAFT_693076 [Crucibulum laeve]|uniref:DUF6534 domain-containing protein n=1 Tax=Crucibulum laeve TaxID=68775 RepID=A0A5C3LGS0_9AGAR|nr:hypothetical protein BDQ12DRAFT_693076 [Crucibulum laeve]